MTSDTFDTDSVVTSGITFSSNLIATATAGTLTSSRIAQATEGKTSGKWYVEFTCGGVSGNADGVGILSSIGLGGGGFIGNTVLSNDPGWAYYTNSHVVHGGSVATSVNATTWGNGDVIGIAIDLDNKKIWWRKNTGSWVGTTGTPDPATNTSGFDITTLQGQGRIYPAANLSGNGAKFTANFGGSAFTGTVPSGFTSGWTKTTTGYFGSFATNGFGQSTNQPPVGDVSVSKYTANASSNLDHIIATVSAGNSRNLKMVVYDTTGTGGLPGALLSTSGVTPAGAGVGELTFSSFSPTLTFVNGTSYYFGFLTDAVSGPPVCEAGGTAAAQIWFGTGSYASPPSTFPASPSTVNFRYPMLIFPVTASTETGTAVMAMSGMSFVGSGGRTETGSGTLALSGVSYTALGKRGPAGHAVMALSGVSMIALGFDLGTAGAGVRQFWTF